jgi:transposase
MKLGKTYQNWYEEIVNSFESKLDNRFVEGYNNKLKGIKRVSYGIKKFSTLKKLIQLKFYQYVDCFFEPSC